MSAVFRGAPAHWRTMRLKETVVACRNGTWGEEPRGGTGDIICVRVTDFDRLRLRARLRNPTLRFVPETQRRGRMLARGDLLLEKSGGGEQQPVGVVVLYDDDAPAVCSNFIARMPVAPGFDAGYLCYLHAALYHLRVNCRSINQSTGIQNLDSGAYLSEVVRVPDLAEQRQIAGFLDVKTTLLDHLLLNKQRLVELLREKRDAQVDHIITAGLDSAEVARSGSDLPELGSIPAHWRATRFKFIRSGALLYGANEPAAGGDRDCPRYIRITDFDEDGALRDDTFQSLPERLAAPYLLRDGDVLLARSGATVGKAFLYREETGRACFASYLVRLRPDRRKILPDYLHYYTQSRTFRHEVRINTVQSTIANVSADRYGNFAIPLPPIEEQRVIVQFLDRRTRLIHSLLRTAQRQIAKLHEYRSALVVTAVTRGCGGSEGGTGAGTARATV
jgi:type I restriction enzyme S subunit